MTASPPPPLPPRHPSGHKGTFGFIAVIGGCARPDTRMIGAPALTATAALRTGAGLAKIIAPEPILNAALTLAPSATGRAFPTTPDGDLIPHEAAAIIDDTVRVADALVIGPGLGRGEGPRAATIRAVRNDQAPVIVDADALNALAETPEFSREIRSRAILTPHPGEFKRLCEGLGLRNHLGLISSHSSSTAETDQARAAACEQLAQRLGCIVILKGANTVVSSGVETWTHTFADAILATAGTGDILAGIVAGLVAQFAERPSAIDDALSSMPGIPPDLIAIMRANAAKQAGLSASKSTLSLFDAARLGVVVHSRAAQSWRGAHGNASGGLLALELAEHIPSAVESIRRPN